jgi:hypothetical protein
VEVGELVEAFEELDEGGSAMEGGEFAAAVGGDDLAEEGDFAGAVVEELLDFAEDVVHGAGAFGAAGFGDDAEGAVHVAALHDGDEGGDLGGVGGGALLR